MDEYNPWRGPNPRDASQMMGGRGEVYLEWLVGSVMALVDRSFPTSTEREATGIVGSSMGGLISLYALMFQPRAFGFAGVMSPSVRWNDYAALRMIGEGKLPPGRIHVDMGDDEWDGHGRRRPAAARRARRRGLATRATTCITSRITRAAINESAWAWRLPDALRFLLAPFRGEAQSAHLWTRPTSCGCPRRSAIAVNSARCAPRQRRSSS